MGRPTTMRLIPTIVILAVLAFFVLLTSTLLIWYWRRNRGQIQKRFSKQSNLKAPRKLTLRDGKAIPHDLALETASDRERYSLDLQSPGIEKEFEYDVERGFTKTTPSKSSKRGSRQSMKNLLADRGQTWTPGRPPWLRKSPDEPLSQTTAEDKMKRNTNGKRRERSGSIPRPSLINIERRGSGQTQRSSDPQPRSQPRQSVGRRASSQTQMTPQMQEKRRGMDITESLFNAYKGSTPWAGEILKLPPSSVVMPGPAKTVASSTRSTSKRWSTPATASLYSSIPTTASFVGSSRAVSDPDPVRPPAPLFSKIEFQSPRMSFAPTQEANRKSFLTITDSPTSSTSSEHAILGHTGSARKIPDEPKSAPPVPTIPTWASTYNEQSRPLKTLSTPAPNPPEVLAKVRAFGRRHRDRPTSTGLRPKRISDLAQYQERPVSLGPRKQVSSELLRHIEQSRTANRRDNATSDLVQQLEETANMVQRQSRAASLAQNQQGPTSMPRQSQSPMPHLSNAILPGETERQRRLPRSDERRPPSIEVDIPHFERGSLSFFDHALTPPRSGNDLGRGPSVMSNRSGFTIASSEISSNWTIGKAELVNIYPSVADDEDEYESIRESMRNSLRHIESPRRSTPPYAKVLRSKYGQYPKGTRDKALPMPPMSPLRQSTLEM